MLFGVGELGVIVLLVFALGVVSSGLDGTGGVGLFHFLVCEYAVEVGQVQAVLDARFEYGGVFFVFHFAEV